ncbi:MAG: hypothetical protein VW405_15515, partial [Rhodospirillaceae bacterium]
MPTPDTTIDIEEELERLRQAELAQPDFGPALDDLAAPGPVADPMQTADGAPAAGGPPSKAEAMAPATTGSAGDMRAAREAEAMALLDRGATLAGEAKQAAAPRDLSSLARTPYEPKPPSATTGFDPMAESVAPDMRPFSNTAADRQWFGRELDRIDTSTPEGAARQRELQAMEPDFSQRMTDSELSKMDAGFQAIARGGRPSGVAPPPGSPRPPAPPAGSQLAELDSRSAGWYKSPLLMNDAELASAMRHREKLAATPGLEMRQSLAALARQPKPPSLVDQARANKYNA